MTTIVVAGALANKAGNGGEAWVRLSWAQGLAGLGADVHLLEEIDTTAFTDRYGGTMKAISPAADQRVRAAE